MYVQTVLANQEPKNMFHSLKYVWGKSNFILKIMYKSVIWIITDIL